MKFEVLGKIRELGLGFARRENGAREKKKKEKRIERMSEPGPEPLYRRARSVRVEPDPALRILDL